MNSGTCKLCNKSLEGMSGNAKYCCKEHFFIDNNKYTGETMNEYMARKVEVLRKRSVISK